MECPSCQHLNEDDARFCTQCGQGLECFCVQCRTVNLETSRFCKRCGSPLVRTSPSRTPYSSPKAYTPKHIADKILHIRLSIQGERKQVTVLACDVAHFTSISEKLDPEDVHAIMDGCFRILMDEIHRYEGTVNQFLGDGLMAIFGAPVTHEDHARRACHAALAVQKALIGYGERLGQKHHIDFKMRIGLNTGLVVVGAIGDDLRMDYTAVGDTTNVAFLLQQTAQPGQILISERTFRAVQGYFQCEYLGEEKLKHRERPIRYYDLLQEGTKRTRLDGEGEEALTRFVGRSEELGMMLDLFERVRTGEGQVLCIGGEAGEGKSRLIYEFKKRIDLDRVLYLESQCISYGKGIPYYPVVEILRKSFHIPEGAPEEVLRKAFEARLKGLDRGLRETVPVLLRLLSIETEKGPPFPEAREKAREMTFEALRLLILTASQKTPLVIVVENLQWIDRTSEEFIAYLIESIPSFPVFLILSFRVGYDPPFGTRSYMRQISLGRLTDRESRKVVQALLPNHHLPYDFLQQILSKAEGNPLYLEEMIQSLLERGIINKEADGYRLQRDLRDLSIPESIQEIVLARVDRLEDPSKRTLQAASVIGREFTLRLLAKQEELERELERYIRELKHLELIREKSLYPEIGYIFKHAVTKDVIYNSLLLQHRKELHRRIAESIERLYSERLEDYLEMLAYHYLHSDAIEKAVNYLLLAGKKASKVFANNEAIDSFQRALELMDLHEGSWDPYRKEAHQWLADLYDLIGDYSRAIRHHSDSMAFVSSPVEKAERLRRIGMICEKRGNIEEAMKAYREAIDLLSPEEHLAESARIWMNIGWVYSRKGDHNRAMEFCLRAQEAFEKEKLDYEKALVLNNLAVIHEFRGEWDLAERYNRESIQWMTRIGDPRKLASFYISVGLLNLKRGRAKPSKTYFKKSLEIMEGIGSPLGIANSYLNLGRVYTLEGNTRKALSCLERSLNMFERMGAKSKICQNYIALAEVHVRRGDAEEAREWCRKGMEIAVEAPYPFDQGVFHRLLGQIGKGKDGDGEENLIKSIEIFRSLGRRYEMAQAMEQLGVCRIAKGQKKEGERFLRDSKKIFNEMGVVGY